MSLSQQRIRRYARQILLAPIGGPGQERLLASTILLHGAAPLAATYLAAAGLGRLLVTSAPPEIEAHDSDFRMERAPIGTTADLVLDLSNGDGYRAASGARLWGGVVSGRVLMGVAPMPLPEAPTPVLETLAAGEALLLLLGGSPRRIEFSV